MPPPMPVLAPGLDKDALDPGPPDIVPPPKADKEGAMAPIEGGTMDGK